MEASLDTPDTGCAAVHAIFEVCEDDVRIIEIDEYSRKNDKTYNRVMDFFDDKKTLLFYARGIYEWNFELSECGNWFTIPPFYPMAHSMAH